MSIFDNNRNNQGYGGDSSRNVPKYANQNGTENIRAFVAETLLLNAPSHHLDRVTRYHLYWNFYEGKHWRQYSETFQSVNYCRVFTNKITSFLLGPRGFSLRVEHAFNEDVDEQVEKDAEAFFSHVWRNNGGVVRQSEIMQMGGVSGDVWIVPQFVEKNGKKILEIKCCDSRQCYPEFVNGDTNNISSLMIRQQLEENPNKYKLLVTKITKTEVIKWYQKDAEWREEKAEKFDKTSTANVYNFINAVHIQNRYNSASFFGISDLVDILKLNKTYNELSQQVKEIVEYYGQPTTVITGGTVKSITKGIGRIFSGLPSDANVFNLGLGEDLGGTLEYMDLIKTAMHEMSDVPENALGRLQAISNTSAAALQVTYQPLIQQADTKSFTYGHGFSELHDMIYRMYKIAVPGHPLVTKLPNKFADNYNVVPNWVYGLPQDYTLDLVNAETELRNRFDSRRNLMNRLGKKNVPAIMEEIRKEQLQEAEDSAAAARMLEPSAGGDGANGNVEQ